jgi:hypothetical protein
MVIIRFSQGRKVVDRLTISVPPKFDPTALVKISINGYPVGEFNAAFMSPKQKSNVMHIAKPSAPSIRIE